jgi:hypothetical protein
MALVGCMLRVMSLKKVDPAKAARQQQSAVDAAAAMAEYRAAIVADREKTARLKALRLAKERLAKEEAEKSKPAASKPPQRGGKRR